MGHITVRQIARYSESLREQEYAQGSIEKYQRDIRQFVDWLGERPVDRSIVGQWRESLLERGYAPATVNAMLASVNRFFRFLGWEDCRVKTLRIQRRLFRSAGRELTKQEYLRLIESAQSLGRERLALLMETVCATGIRVSEVKYITMEAIEAGQAEIRLKGKIRTILIPGKLRRKLKKYGKRQKIRSGEIFLTRSGKSISRRQIWAEMKGLCQKAGVPASKVFPHNLRHLFARTYYRTYRDIVQLADILGHSHVETTRIYLVSTGQEHIQRMERLNLVS